MVGSSIAVCMKSVGKGTSVGRIFEEIIQKTGRITDKSINDFDAKCFELRQEHRGKPDGLASIYEKLKTPMPLCMWAIVKPLELGMFVEEVR